METPETPRQAERPPRQAEGPPRQAEGPPRQAERPRRQAEPPRRQAQRPPRQAEHPRRQAEGRRRRRRSSAVVAALTAASALGGALAGAHPTGTPVVDPLYGAVLAGGVAFCASQARRWSWLILAGAALAMSRAWLLLPAAGAMGAAFGSVFLRRRQQRLGALTGALAAQVLLRWPPALFHGFSALVAFAAVAPVVVSAYHNSPSRWRRRARLGLGGGLVAGAVLVAPTVVGVLLARAPVSAGVAAARGALDAVGNGGGPAAGASLARASADFATAQRLTEPWWGAGADLVPVAAQQRRALGGATGAGRAVSAVAGQVSGPLAALRTGYRGGRLDLARLAGLAGPLDRLDRQLGAAVHQVGALGSGWLVGPVQSRLASVRAQLDRAAATTDLAAQAVSALPGLLGGNGARHYFVAFMTPAESRGLDGFVGSYGLLSASGGRLSLSAAGPIAQLIDAAPPGARRLTGLGAYLARYGQFHPADNFQDVSYSPDFPTVAKVISQLYPQSGGQAIDGVLAIDPYGLAALLDFTGPIAVAGLAEPLSAANAAQELTIGQYLQYGSAAAQGARHDVLQEALQVAFTKLAAGSLPAPAALAAQVRPAVRQGRIMFWSNHPSEQPLVRRLGLDGSFPAPRGGDLLAVTTQNAANSKIDAYLHRTITDSVSYDPGDGKEGATVTVALTNDAPASGLPFEVIGSYPGSHLPPGTNYTWLSVYSPLHLVGASVAGAPVPMTATPELGVEAYSAHLVVPAGDTVTVTLHLSGRLSTGGAYRLALRSQPMVNPDVDRVELSRPGGAGGTVDWAPDGGALVSSRVVRFG